MIVKCPACGRPVHPDTQNQWGPFCSERCRLIDLGNWMDGT
ncbi:MAG: DNA gyrase inhibitor YacG, partial [Gammaproteobacteria bacterium]